MIALGILLFFLAATSCRVEADSHTAIHSVTDTTLVTVDVGITHQVIAGFGANTRPLVYPAGDYLGDSRQDVIRIVYGTVGLSLGHLGVGIIETPADATNLWTARRNDNDDPFSINDDGFNFLGLNIIKEKILDPANPYGYQDVTLGPILNLKGPLEFLQDIRSNDYERYLNEAAEHTLAIVRYWETTYGYSLDMLQLFNEPTSGDRELSSTSTQEVVDLVKRIGQRLSTAGYANIKFLVPNEETVARTYEVAQKLLADTEARKYVGAIGYHTYPYDSPYASIEKILNTSGHGTPRANALRDRQDLLALAKQYDIPLWMTEVSLGPGNSDYPFGAIENLRGRAIHIHDELLYAEASAFFGMNTFWDSRSHEEHFAGRNVDFFSEQSGIVLFDADAKKTYITGMGYAIGHYARWVKPGAVRVDATSLNPLIQVSAFKDVERDQLILVLLNNETSEQVIQIQLRGASAGSPITGEQSFQDVRWQTIAPFSPSAQEEWHLAVPPESVTTLSLPLTETSVDRDEETPLGAFRMTNYPNPFTDVTTLTFFLPQSEHVSLTVNDIRGRKVATLIDRTLPSGEYHIPFDASDLPNGVFLYRLMTSRINKIGKMLLFR